MRNLYGRLRKIEDHMASIPDGIQTLYFSDGTTKEINVGKMFRSIQEDPNADVQFMLDKLEKGVEDEGGLVHLVYAESYNDVELWEDETNELPTQ